MHFWIFLSENVRNVFSNIFFVSMTSISKTWGKKKKKRQTQAWKKRTSSHTPHHKPTPSETSETFTRWRLRSRCPGPINHCMTLPVLTFSCRSCMDFSKVLGAALWWLHRIATARFARLYDRIFSSTVMSSENTPNKSQSTQTQLSVTETQVTEHNTWDQNCRGLLWFIGNMSMAWCLHSTPLH